MPNVKVRNDHASDVSSGIVDFESFWYKFGEGSVDSVLTTIWSGEGLQPGLYIQPDYANEGVAVKMRCKSTQASDAGKTINFTGLDKHWKIQSEDLVLNGTTYVETQYEYLRIFRASMIYGDLDGVWTMEELAGGNDYIYAHIENSGQHVNQTQMAFYPVAAGHALSVKKITCTKADANAVKIYASIRDIGMFGYDDGAGNKTPYRAQLNWNADQVGFEDETPHPFYLTEKLDLEIRGKAVSNKASDVAINLFGHLEQCNSVPIDLTTYTVVTGGIGEVVVSWDAQTPAETSDMQYFVVEWWFDNRKIGQEAIEDKTSTGSTITGLESGVEYTIKAYWKGYDDRKSTIESATVTVL